MESVKSDLSSRKVGAFVSSLKFEDIPPHIVETAKGLVMDAVRLSIAGSQLPWGQGTAKMFTDIGGKEEATVLGYSARLPATSAAFVNATTCHGLENDDTHAQAVLHPGPVIVPAVLAVAERNGLTGKDLLRGMIVGYEVMCRSGIATQPSMLNDRGYHGTSVHGHIGAAAATANLLGLSHEGCVHALAFGVSYASGLVNWLSGGMVKAVHAGKAAKGGIEAALLASYGLKGPRQIFEGPFGFLNAYSAKYDTEKLYQGLGEDWKSGEIHLKPHATTRNIQSAIEATGMIAAAHNISADDVERVEVYTAPGLLADSETTPEPVDVIEAQSSFPFAVAAALAKGGERTLREFVLFDDLRRAVEDQEVRALARRVHLVKEPNFDFQKFQARVTITLRNGQSHTQQVDIMRGSPENPFTPAEIRGRFLDQGQAVVPRANLERLADEIEGLDKVLDIRKMMALGQRS